MFAEDRKKIHPPLRFCWKCTKYVTDALNRKLDQEALKMQLVAIKQKIFDFLPHDDGQKCIYCSQDELQNQDNEPAAVDPIEARVEPPEHGCSSEVNFRAFFTIKYFA